jgi:pimeloyl-ACP methyl ester carboxylesterase
MTHFDSKRPRPVGSPLGVKPELIESGGWRVALHVASPPKPTAPPLLLIHSINATASVVEMQALFESQSQRRTVVALDLPGFGASDRLPGPYTPGVMVRAVLDTLEFMRRHVDPVPADVAALSLSCEFAALAALAEPDSMRSLAMISPTGMERRRIGEPYDGRTRQSLLIAVLLRMPGVGRALYRLFTTRPSIRWFLARTWGTRHFDEALLAQGYAHARVPGARFAPLAFMSGALFTRGIVACYSKLDLPVLVAQGRRGAFTDFEAYGNVAAKSPGKWQRRVFETGAMPHQEWPADFDAAYQAWLSGHVLPAPVHAPAQSSLGFGANAAHSYRPGARGDGDRAARDRVHPGNATAPMAGAR